MVEENYIPDRGDLVWFNPKSGHEQSGKRPALVLSPATYNGKVGLALFCPVTSKAKGYPFEVNIPQDLPIEGVILSDQIKSLDWQFRGARFICRVPQETLDEVLQKVGLLIH
ncbi:endoribonuclease MazF [Paenibacillus campinasensis]|uniref:mRNA-degrading endonuclease n=1 Tax=Paenibacillus campinasensis TaxID=66347 RepID=A0A268EF09_9BACL|nr:endoribonuclease MazF [Paenibacillus campinasensis]PAD71693.1 mRNA-degrading endonuclease [Paenibacillus campinasensis]